MKLLTLETNNIDDMWDEVREAFRAADLAYDEMMYDMDEGRPPSYKSFKTEIEHLEHKLRVFREETEV